MMRTQLVVVAVFVLSALGACGGSNKPPMQPDNDNASLGDGGGAAPAAPASPASAPAHS
jgi:hypothetical protein